MAFLEKMQLHLGGSDNAFVNQCLARNRLIQLLKNTHGPLPQLEYEELFRRYYSELNEEEKVLFGLIRGITRTSLHKHNKEMLGLLESHPDYCKEVPELKELHEHLNLWIAKYDGLLADLVSQEVC